MKPRILLLFKLLGYSFLLFLVGHNFLHWYAASLTDWLNTQDPRYHLPPNLQDFLYRTSVTVIAFMSLMLSTPRMPVLKKAGAASVGIAVFFLTDFFFIQFLKGGPALPEDSVVFEVYLCIKWLLPFLLWLLPNYRSMAGINMGKWEQRLF